MNKPRIVDLFVSCALVCYAEMLNKSLIHNHLIVLSVSGYFLQTCDIFGTFKEDGRVFSGYGKNITPSQNSYIFVNTLLPGNDNEKLNN